MGSLQGKVSSDPGTSGSTGLPGVDLPQPEEALAGQGGGGQEPPDEGLPGLHEVRHPSHAQPCQCAHSPHGALLRLTVRHRGRAQSPWSVFSGKDNKLTLQGCSVY